MIEFALGFTVGMVAQGLWGRFMAGWRRPK